MGGAARRRRGCPRRRRRPRGGRPRWRRPAPCGAAVMPAERSGRGAPAWPPPPTPSSPPGLGPLGESWGYGGGPRRPAPEPRRGPRGGGRRGRAGRAGPPPLGGRGRGCGRTPPSLAARRPLVGSGEPRYPAQAPVLPRIPLGLCPPAPHRAPRGLPGRWGVPSPPRSPSPSRRGESDGVPAPRCVPASCWALGFGVCAPRRVGTTRECCKIRCSRLDVRGVSRSPAQKLREKPRSSASLLQSIYLERSLFN